MADNTEHSKLRIRVRPISPTEAEVACFNCGDMVRVTLPLYGCVYCEECSRLTVYSSAPREGG
ncbi:hypothetical protein ES703_60086 [subsurface metagenome]